MIFYDEPLFHIFRILSERIKELKANGVIEFEVVDPDSSNEFSGTMICIEGVRYAYRSFKVWTDLAEILHCKIMTPKTLDNNRILIRYKLIDTKRSWHNHSDADITERYGCGSEFSKIFKFEEPNFLNDYLRCLKEVGIKDGVKVLDLGINRADEFKVFNEFFKDHAANSTFTGIDHCRSALRVASYELSSDNYIFYNEDISNISSLKIPQQDIVISIGTLQSPELDGKAVLRYIVQNLIKENGSIILGFPNSRYIDREVIYGAKTKNYTESNLNLLIKDISFYKKYLQQHKFKVITFGKYYIFLVAKRDRKKDKGE